MMRLLIPALSLGLILGLSGCTSAGELEPVPGSITYGGQPATRLTKAPVGSTVTHRFRDQFNQEWGERYVIQPDRSRAHVSPNRVEYPDD